MFSRKLAVLAAFSLATAGTVAHAQSAASLSLAPAAVERAGADVEGANELAGTTVWILGAVALGLVIWGIIELTDDNDEPTSP
ncbi:MAG: hypothetical protein KF780_13105 [Sphingomonas sp.]|nr:hypothetical protein [Sphingomonas sp.]